MKNDAVTYLFKQEQSVSN